MPRTRMAGTYGVVLLVALAGLVLAPARASADPPLVTDTVVFPSLLPHTGGTIAIDASIADESGIVSAWAAITAPDGTVRSVEMQPTGGDHYTAEASIPPNATDARVDHQVVIEATDGDGESVGAFAGEVSVDPEPQFDERPAVSDPSVTPRNLPRAGGPVTIQATATDNISVAWVFATITLPSGATTQVDLQPISATRFEGVFDAPANPSPTPATYGVRITAYDDLGQTDEIDAGRFVVAPVKPQLKVTPKALVVGAVRVGRTARASFVLEHTGPQGSGVLTGTIPRPAAPFVLFGSGKDGLGFRLAPGQRRTISVGFRPQKPGPRSTMLAIDRADGRQPDLAVQLFGWGLAP